MWRPAACLLLLAPVLGEVGSTATPPSSLVQPFTLVVLVLLYGGGTLLCRELALRSGGGLPSLVLLGMAYGVVEEALVDRFWFDPAYWRHTGVGDYAAVWDTNVLLAGHLTLFHATVSVTCSVLIVEWLFPAARGRAWIGPRGLVLAGVGLVTVFAVTFGEYVTPRPAQSVVAVLLALLLVAAAFQLPTSARRQEPAVSRPRLAAVIAFVCTAAQFVLTYAVPSTGLPWPLGVVVAFAPAGVGVLVVPRLVRGGPLDRGGLWVVTGVLTWFALLATAVGLGGSYDLSAAGLLAFLALWWLHRRVRATPTLS